MNNPKITKAGLPLRSGSRYQQPSIAPSKEELPNSKLSTFFLRATGTTGLDLRLAALDGFNERIGNKRDHLRQ
jgi:hypothetical protein